MAYDKKREYQIELFLSRSQRMQNDILDLSHLGVSLDIIQSKSKTLEILQSFPEKLLKESMNMSDCYQILYCFENDVREIVNDIMYQSYGDNWWDAHVIQKIQDEVKKRQNAEKDSVYFGRVDDPLYFTTLGELKEIITGNYEIFTNLFRSKRFVDELLFQINRLRIVVGHNCMLEDMDVTTLKQNIERWYTVK